MNTRDFVLMKGNDIRENIFPKPTTDKEAWEIVSTHILGKNWYTVNPVSHDQINTEMLWEILTMIPSYEYTQLPWYKKLWYRMKCFLTGESISKYY